LKPPSPEVFYWILGAGGLMSVIALVGSLTLVLKEATLQKILLPLVGLSAGSLLGGAFFHMLPAAVVEMQNSLALYIWILIGFVLFFCLEQFLHWHHCHKTVSQHKKPLTYLILIADGVHNFIGGLAVAGSFLIDIQVGIMAWLAAAVHEVPQELGDFGVLVHGGWSKRKALLFNFLSALTFLVGGLLAYFISFRSNVSFLVPFAAGNFIYIAAVDLVPEINKHESIRVNIVHFMSFVSGLVLLAVLKIMFGG